MFSPEDIEIIFVKKFANLIRTSCAARCIFEVVAVKFFIHNCDNNCSWPTWNIRNDIHVTICRIHYDWKCKAHHKLALDLAPGSFTQICRQLLMHAKCTHCSHISRRYIRNKWSLSSACWKYDWIIISKWTLLNTLLTPWFNRLITCFHVFLRDWSLASRWAWRILLSVLPTAKSCKHKKSCPLPSNA